MWPPWPTHQATLRSCTAPKGRCHAGASCTTRCRAQTRTCGHAVTSVCYCKGRRGTWPHSTNAHMLLLTGMSIVLAVLSRGQPQDRPTESAAAPGSPPHCCACQEVCKAFPLRLAPPQPSDQHRRGWQAACCHHPRQHPSHCLRWRAGTAGQRRRHVVHVRGQ